MKYIYLSFCLAVALVASPQMFAQDDIVSEEGYVILEGQLLMQDNKPVFVSYSCSTPGVYKIDSKGDKKSAKKVKSIGKALSGGGLDEVTLKGKLYADEMIIAPKNYSIQMPMPSCMTDITLMAKIPAHCAYVTAIYSLYLHNIELIKAFRFFSVISEEVYDEELGENVSVVTCYDVDCREIDCQTGKRESQEAWDQINLQIEMVETILQPQIDLAKEAVQPELETLQGLDKVNAKLLMAQAKIMQTKNLSTLPKILKARKESRAAMKMVKD